MEWVDGKIWLNVYMTNRIVKVDYELGKVVEEYDGSALTAHEKGRKYGEVLNGIAYHQQSGKYILTGKYWDKYYQISFD